MFDEDSEEDVMVVQEDVAESTPFAFRASSNSKNPSDPVRRRKYRGAAFPLA
jgi:septin family protein